MFPVGNAHPLHLRPMSLAQILLITPQIQFQENVINLFEYLFYLFPLNNIDVKNVRQKIKLWKILDAGTIKKSYNEIWLSLTTYLWRCIKINFFNFFPQGCWLRRNYINHQINKAFHRSRSCWHPSWRLKSWNKEMWPYGRKSSCFN